MSNNNSKNSKTGNEKKSTDNKAVTGVEVVKDDTVVFENGDFEDYNAEHDYQEDKDQKKKDQEKKADSSTKNDKSDDDKSDKQDKSDKSSKSKDTDKDQKSSKDDTDTEDSKSDQKDEADKKDESEQDDTSNMTMAGIFQWASKLREDFMSEATGITNGVTEKAAAMTLQRLIAVVDMELAAFDKSVEVAKKLIANVEEERAKIVSRKDKYQGMIDKLDQE